MLVCQQRKERQPGYRFFAQKQAYAHFDIPSTAVDRIVTVFGKNAVYEAMITVAIAVEKDYRNRGT